MVYSIINNKDIDTSDALLLSACYDRTASGRKGASKGPGRIVDCLNKSLEFYDRFTKDEPAYMYKVIHEDIGEINDLLPEKMVETVSQKYKQYLTKNRFIILLGGEHSVTIGGLSAISAVQDPSKISIVHIDAHFDLRDSDSDYNDISPSNYAHSCVMRRAHEFGFNIVTVGVRTGSREEYEYAEKNITFFEWGKSDTPSLDSIIQSIKTEKVYISIDVDGIDPSQMPATGTPVQGGLQWDYAVNLVKRILSEKDVIATDIVEVAPTSEDVLTEYGAAQLCYLMISDKLHKK